MADQSVVALIGHAGGGASLLVRGVVVAVLAVPALVYVFRRKVAARHLVGGALIGLLVPAGFAVTGIIGVDEFNPVPPESITVTGPLAQTLVYGLTYTGATMDFGIAWILGIPVGAAIVALLRGDMRLEGFDGAAGTRRYLVGGVLMGVGGVLSIGCTIGQGLSGVSTTSIGSLLAIASISAGAAVTMKWRQRTAAIPVAAASRS
jgi:hypothetical protein